VGDIRKTPAPVVTLGLNERRRQRQAESVRLSVASARAWIGDQINAWAGLGNPTTRPPRLAVRIPLLWE